MTIFNAADYGVMPGWEVTRPLAALLRLVCSAPGPKTLRFEPGTYRIDADACEQHTLYITNTAGDEEYAPGETPHLQSVALYLRGAEQLTIEGNGAVFEILGRATNLAAEDCPGLTISGIEFRHSQPDMHEFRAISVCADCVEYRMDDDTAFDVQDGRLTFTVGSLRVDAHKDADIANWIGLVREATPDRIERVAHPLQGALGIERTGERTIRVRYADTARFLPGDRLYLYYVRRQYVGMFINRCRDVLLTGIRQRFNYSLALVLQDCENAALRNSIFAPEPGSPRMVASGADFIQACMCRGLLRFEGNYFEGACDDCMNVHGVHLTIQEVCGSRIRVRYMHPQTHGYNPFHAGDEIAFIDSDTMLETGRARLLSSAMNGEHELVLTVDDAGSARAGMAVENASAAPDVIFRSNFISRIITRGLLLTSRGRILVEGNHIRNVNSHFIEISDDANYWFESSMCKDVTIRDNTVECCDLSPILIKPINKVHAGAVHSHIAITGNRFLRHEGSSIWARSVDDLLITGNRCIREPVLTGEHCTDVRITDNTVTG